MNNSFTFELEQYYREVSALLVCSLKQKKAFISDFKSCVDDYIADKPDCTVKDIENQFGSPEEISRSFMENSSAAQIKKRLDIKKVIITAVLIALLIWLIFAVLSLIDVHWEAHGTIVEGLLIINALTGGV